MKRSRLSALVAVVVTACASNAFAQAADPACEKQKEWESKVAALQVRYNTDEANRNVGLKQSIKREITAGDAEIKTAKAACAAANKAAADAKVKADADAKAKAAAEAKAKAEAPAKAVADCKAKNIALEKELDSMFATARSTGQVTAADERKFQEYAYRIKAFRAALLRKDDKSKLDELPDCEAVTRDYEAAKQLVAKMLEEITKRKPFADGKEKAAAEAKAEAEAEAKAKAAAEAKAKRVEAQAKAVADCKAKNIALEKELDSMFATARSTGQVTAADERKFQEYAYRIKAFRAALLRKDDKSKLDELPDCEAMTRDYEAAKQLVAKMLEEITKRKPVIPPPKKPG